jgi:hypothetical protein
MLFDVTMRYNARADPIFAIGSDFRWRVSPMDKRSNRQMIAELVQNDIKENNGVFPEKNLFIDRK